MVDIISMCCFVWLLYSPIMPMKKIQIAEWPWQQTDLEPDSQYLSKYCSFFLSWMSALNPITMCSCWFSQIWKVLEKSLCFLSWEITGLDLRHLQVSTIQEEGHSHFITANSGLPLLPPLLKVGERECICRSKKVNSLYFSIFHTVFA